MQDGRPVGLHSPTSRTPTLRFPTLGTRTSRFPTLRFPTLRSPTLRSPPLDSPALFKLIVGNERFSNYYLQCTRRGRLLMKYPGDYDNFEDTLDYLRCNGPYPMIWKPNLDIYEYGDSLLVARLEIPGITKEDVKVIFVHNNEIEQDFLVIYGNRPRPGASPDGQYRYLCTTIKSGPFYRMFHLPDDTRKETLHWCFEYGILKVMLHRNPWRRDPPPPVLMCRCTLMNPS